MFGPARPRGAAARGALTRGVCAALSDLFNNDLTGPVTDQYSGMPALTILCAVARRSWRAAGGAGGGGGGGGATHSSTIAVRPERDGMSPENAFAERSRNVSFVRSLTDVGIAPSNLLKERSLHAAGGQWAP